MEFRGPLGIRRFTAIGPFVSATEEKRRFVAIIAESADNLDIDIEDMTDEEEKQLNAEIARNYYSGDSELQKAKRVRMETCLNERWSNNWIDGMQEGLGFEFRKIEQMAQKASACKALVKNATTDDERQLP